MAEGIFLKKQVGKAYGNRQPGTKSVRGSDRDLS